MGGRPSKPVNVIKMEKKSHRTKKELALREKSEKNLVTGSRLKESPSVKADPVAHKEFMRVRKLLKVMEKDDDLYHNQINTYCLLHAEIQKLSEEAEAQRKDIEELRAAKENFDDEKEYWDLLAKAKKRLDNIDLKIDRKRTHREKIDRDNGLTITAALRTVPKKPEKNTSELKRALYGS